MCVPGALARLDGEIEWGYANYDESSDSGDDLSASHFTQRYSVLYSMKGLLGGGRLGAYDLGAGAEWAAFETDLNGQDLDGDAFKLLYNGRLQIAPGALPFRLDVYSYDLAKVGFGTAWRGGLLSPDIVTDLYNGQTIVSGIQFMAGIRNGSYLGKYRDAISKWPRLLVDYRDVYRSDLDARVPQEYRDQNLAFVSLNKKDNWFHYRVHTHTDYQRPINDSKESVIMLGTIDHTLQRQWIDLTNWIRISADGSFTKTEMNWDSRETNRFDVNFFTVMQRNGFDAASFPNLQRIKRGDELEQNLEVPVYVNNRINLDTNLRSSFELWRNKDMRPGLIDDENEEAYHTNVLLQTNMRGRVQVDPSLEAEIHTGNVGEGEAIRGRVEAYSNLKRRNNLNWYSMGSLALFSGSGDHDENTSLWESELKGGTSYSLGRSMRVGGEQYLLYGSGTYDSRSTHFMRSASAGGFGNNSYTDSRFVDGSLFRSTTNLYFEHTSAARVQNRFELTYRFQDSETEQLYNLELAHRLDYRSRVWRVTLENLYTTGDDVDSRAPGASSLGAVFNDTTAAEQFQHRGIVEFHPNIYWKNRLDATLYWGHDASGQSNQYLMATQSLERTFYTAGGFRRERGHITQSLVYEQHQNGNDRQAVVFSLSGEYLPTSYWRLGASMYYYYKDFASNSMYYTLTTGLDFPLLQVDFSYQYGIRDEDNVVAHRYEVNVRKTF